MVWYSDKMTKSRKESGVSFKPTKLQKGPLIGGKKKGGISELIENLTYGPIDLGPIDQEMTVIEKTVCYS